MSQQNSIQKLNEWFQSFGIQPQYRFHQTGPCHNPIFTCGVNMFNRSVTATGKSKKMAKNRAASLLLKKFQTQHQSRAITPKTPPISPCHRPTLSPSPQIKLEPNSPCYRPTLSPGPQIKFEPIYDTNVEVYIQIKQEPPSPNPNTLHLIQDSPKFIPVYQTITPRKLFQ